MSRGSRLVALCSHTVGATEWACYGTQRRWNVWGQEETDRETRAAMLSGGKRRKTTFVGDGGVLSASRAASHQSIFRSSLSKI